MSICNCGTWTEKVFGESSPVESLTGFHDDDIEGCIVQLLKPICSRNDKDWNVHYSHISSLHLTIGYLENN